jgi:hypothetical protein
MAREVGEQDVKHVVVNCDVVHITIVVISNSRLQMPCGPNIMRGGLGKAGQEFT